MIARQPPLIIGLAEVLGRRMRGSGLVDDRKGLRQELGSSFFSPSLKDTGLICQVEGLGRNSL